MSSNEYNIHNEPKIAILMAVYEPNVDWLEEQLSSLNEQTYSNITLYIRDDGSSATSFDATQACAKRCVTKFSYVITKNPSNLGSNLTFESLTQEAEADYFAYCDQDDRWLPCKLEMLLTQIQREGKALICSDMEVIDDNGKVVASSITRVRKRHIFIKDTAQQSKELLYRNFVTGCTMMVERSLAQQAIPFPATMVHDHFLALRAAMNGGIAVCMQPLIQYRIHSNNQTGVLKHVYNHESYYVQHLHQFTERCLELQSRVDSHVLADAVEWSAAREGYYKRAPGSFIDLYRLRHVNLRTSLFELVALRLPPSLFTLALTMVRR